MNVNITNTGRKQETETHLDQLCVPCCEKLLLKVPVLGEFVPNSHFHLQSNVVSLQEVKIGVEDTHCFDIVVLPILPDFGLESACLRESHARPGIARPDMFSQQWTMGELTRWDQPNLSRPEEGTHLQGLEQVFTRGINPSFILDTVV